MKGSAMRRSRVCRYIVFVSSALLLTILPGCGRASGDYPPAPDRPVANAVALVSRPLITETDTIPADYGTIVVQENRTRPGSRLISIPFLRLRTRASRPGEPIFAFAGGPGASNMSWDWGKAGAFLPQRDFVVVGYRGVDGSTRLDCPEVAEAFKGNGDLLGEQSIRRIADAWTAAGIRLAAEGVDLDGYTMLETIDDNEAVRNALGYERIDLLSESYGTRVAYLYGLRYPERIRRSAMAAVNPPGHFVWDPITIDRQLRQYAALWSRDSAASVRSPDLYASLRSVLAATPRRWLVFPIDPGKVRVTTFPLLFHRSTAAMVFDAYVAADHGDPSGLALMSLAYNFVVPSLGVWGDLASKATSADTYHSGNEATPLGSPMNRVLWGPLAYCRWPTRQIPEEFRIPRRSEVETLLLSGSVDFSTPAECASAELLPYLTHGRQIVLSECGHVLDLWYEHEENTRRILGSFYDTGVPDVSLNTYVPVDFSVSWGFPRIAKFALGGVLVVLAALSLLLSYLLRKALRRIRSAGQAVVAKQQT